MLNSDFSSKEYARRCEKAQQLMEKADLDSLLINGLENLTYFSGFRKTGVAKGRPYFMLLPREDPPILVAPLTAKGNIEEMSWLFPDGVLFWEGAPAHPTLPKNSSEAVIHLLRENELVKRRIGLELGRYMRLDMTQVEFENLKRELPHAQFVDAADIIWELRSIKSPDEIKYMKKSCDITWRALKQGILSAKEGMTEREFARSVYMYMLEEGGEEDPLKMWQHVRSGPERYRILNPRPSDKKMKKGDLVVVDLGAYYRGYWADMMRMFCIGPPTVKQKEMYEVAFQAYEAGVKALGPGVKVKDVYSSAMDVIKDSGYIENTLGEALGHGIGMDLHEPPRLHPSQGEEILRPGMVVTIEPAIYDTPIIEGLPGGIGVFMLEDEILITEGGYEILTPMEKDLEVV